MRFLFILTFSFLLTVILQIPAVAAISYGTPGDIEAPSGLNLHNNDASFLLWFVDGYFEMEGGPPAAGNRWVIDHPTNGRAALFDVELKMGPRFSYDLVFGIGVIDDGRVTDADFDAAAVLSDLSYSTGSGYWALFGANTYIRAFETPSAVMDFSLGYLYLRSSMDYSDPNYVIENYNPSVIAWQERWLTYDLLYYGIRLGTRGELRIGNAFSVKAEAGFIPWLQANYEGLRNPDMWYRELEAIEADGLGVDTSVSVEFSPNRGLVFLLGYKYISFKTDGRDIPGTAWAGSWEELSMELKGLFAAFSFSF